MDATTVAIDLAKNVFELVVADARNQLIEHKHLSRAAFMRFFDSRCACRIVMEACGSAHYWGRRFLGASSPPHFTTVHRHGIR